MKKSRRFLARLLELTPKPLVWKFARTYIAGETLADAMRVIRGLNSEGCRATVDVLGESVRDEREVEFFVETYRQTIEALVRDGLDSNISVKPTAMGLLISPELTRRSIIEILRHAKKHGMFVRIDMEDSSTTSSTLELVEQLKADGFDNVGVALQSYLRRTLADALRLARAGMSIRLCKGIYVEPREVAYQAFDTIRYSYIAALEAILSEPNAYVGIATHDEFLTVAARALIQKWGSTRERYEFQMLLGVDPLLRRLLVAEGHPLRVYVPFGKGWHPYSIRRLLENPRMARHVIQNVLGFGPGK